MQVISHISHLSRPCDLENYCILNISCIVTFGDYLVYFSLVLTACLLFFRDQFSTKARGAAEATGNAASGCFRLLTNPLISFYQ
jgi:hypothetical protein